MAQVVTAAVEPLWPIGRDDPPGLGVFIAAELICEDKETPPCRAGFASFPYLTPSSLPGGSGVHCAHA